MLKTFSFYCILLFFSAPANAVVYVSNSSLPANTTSECLNALTDNIACDNTIRKLRPGLYYPESALETICTSSCDSALSSFENTVISACVGQTYDSQTDIGFVPIYTIPEVLRYQFNISCLSSGGQFCNVLAASAAGIAADQSNLNNASSTGGDSDACTDCTLQTLQFEASSPYYSGDDVVSIYSSRTSSCSATGYPLSTSTFAFSVPVPTTTLTPCTGETYDIKSGDTCESVSKSQGIGTSWLLSDNNLAASCADFPSNGTLCLAHTCNTYTVQENDTCTSMAAAQQITYAQVLAWNPNFDLQCSNINKTVGFEICINAPGVQYIPPTVVFVPTVAVTAAAVPTNAAAGTNTNCGLWYEALPGDFCELLVIKYTISLADFLFLNPEVNTNCTNLFAFESYCVEAVGDISDYPGAPGFVNPTPTSNASMIAFASLPDATFIPDLFNATIVTYANGTRTDCETYILGSDYQMNLTGTFYNNNCELAANTFDLDATTFEYLNPTLNISDPDCSLNPDLSYCVLWSGAFPTSAPVPTAAPYPIRNGTTTNCDQYGGAYPGTSCADLLAEYCIDIADFFSWNPEVGSDCTGLETEFQYCMAGTGFTPTCSVETFPAGTQTGSIPTSTSLTPPGPTQSGEPSNCNQWYLAKSGDSCSLIETTFSITSAQFLAWNPAVSSDCSTGFDAGDAYCVGISNTVSTTTTATPPGPTQSGEPANCDEWYLAQSGDSCSAIESTFSITSTQFLAWNPAVASDCSTGFDAGEAYCVGISSASSPTTTTSAASTTSKAPAIPSPTQSNSIISTCDSYAITVSGDGCFSFADEHGITTDELYAWNTVLGADGANCGTDLELGYYYCIGISG